MSNIIEKEQLEFTLRRYLGLDTTVTPGLSLEYYLARLLSNLPMPENKKPVMPLKFKVIQYPGDATPDIMFGEGVWSDISSKVAGATIRFAGGNASVFGSGLQKESVPNITGSCMEWVNVGMLKGNNNIPTGAFRMGAASGTAGYNTGSAASTNNALDIDASYSHIAYGRRSEVFPNNYTVVLWEKIQHTAEPDDNNPIRYVLPNLFVYTQYPGMEAPYELEGERVQDWVNITNQFAGLFFRAEGGNAAGFDVVGNAAVQGSQNLSHTHSLNVRGNASPAEEGVQHANGSGTLTNVIHASGGNEARPINKSIRIWQKQVQA